MRQPNMVNRIPRFRVNGCSGASRKSGIRSLKPASPWETHADLGESRSEGVQSRRIAYFDRKSGGLQPILASGGENSFSSFPGLVTVAATSRNRKERTGAAAGDKKGQASPARGLYPRILFCRRYTTPIFKKNEKKRTFLPQSQACCPA